MVSGSEPLSGTLATAILAFALLAAGLAFEASAVGKIIGQVVAQGIAVLAQPTLHLLGVETIRTGVELRAASGAWAVRINQVCDGMGLVVALAVLLAVVIPSGGVFRATSTAGHKSVAPQARTRPGAAFRAHWRGPLAVFIAGIMIIQVFNFVRVLALAGALHAWPEVFGRLHDLVFPLLTVLVLAAILVPPLKLAALSALTAVFMLGWAQIGSQASALLVPVANLALPLGLAELGTIAERGGVWSVGTALLAGVEPLRLHVVPLDPAHFTTAMPVLLASTLIARAPVWALAGVAMMLLALIVASPVAVWTRALAEAPATVLLPVGGNGFIAADFAPPAMLHGLLRLIQNTLVHFLLLVLPILALVGAPRRERGAHAYPNRTR